MRMINSHLLKTRIRRSMVLKTSLLTHLIEILKRCKALKIYKTNHVIRRMGIWKKMISKASYKTWLKRNLFKGLQLTKRTKICKNWLKLFSKMMFQSTIKIKIKANVHKKISRRNQRAPKTTQLQCHQTSIRKTKLQRVRK